MSAVEVLKTLWGGGGEERKIASNKQFLRFSTLFFTFMENFLPFSSNLKFHLLTFLSLEGPKPCFLENGEKDLKIMKCILSVS